MAMKTPDKKIVCTWQNEMSATNSCMLVGSCLHCRGASVLQRSGFSTIGDILRHRRESLAVLHAWTLEYQHLMLCV